jgi:putative FmdB family regulatory protein
MPIFEYACEECGNKFEAIVFGGKEPECPKCHTQKLQVQLSTFAVTSKSHSAPATGCGAESCCMGRGGCEMN